MPCQSRIQITTPRAGFQQGNRPITARELFKGPLEAPAGGGGAPAVKLGWYLHVPFCFHKCHYCDFYSIVDSRDRQASFTGRLIEEIEAFSTFHPQIVPHPSTIFVGGGTPTLLRIDLWERLLAALAPWAGEGIEFTVEANPETVTPELAKTLAAGGVNRVSIGAQSFNPIHLKTLERWHDPANVGRAVEWFRGAGIARVNLDLIFGIPGQTLDDWWADLDAALALAPAHLSCYGLMYEPNTALTARMRAGSVQPIDDDVEAAMYELTIDALAAHGYEHYEISAWAKPGEQCNHNLLYWTNANWWPFGPSASGHWNGTRWKNVARLGEYIESRDLPPITEVEQVDADVRVGEELMLSLRLIKGIERERYQHLLAQGRRGEARDIAVRQAIDRGHLVWANDCLRLTRDGLMLADEVISELL